MNFRTATLLVLGMFGSFMIVITAMMLLFWSPESEKVDRNQPPPVRMQRTIQPDPVTVEPDPELDELVPASRGETTGPTQAGIGAPPISTLPAESEENGRPAPSAEPVRSPGRMTQKNVEIEQGEMKLLRAEMERRLKEQSLNKEKKMDQLARRCETLEAGEAVQILTILEDEHLREVLKRMKRDKALPIAALLERLGRGKAISLK